MTILVRTLISLNHVGIRQPNGEYLIYNGIRNRDVIDTFGTKKLGIETMPLLITRGILIDVAGFKGKEYLDADRKKSKKIYITFLVEWLIIEMRCIAAERSDLQTPSLPTRPLVVAARRRAMISNT